MGRFEEEEKVCSSVLLFPSKAHKCVHLQNEKFAMLWRDLLSYCFNSDCMIFCSNLHFSSFFLYGFLRLGASFSNVFKNFLAVFCQLCLAVLIIIFQYDCRVWKCGIFKGMAVCWLDDVIFLKSVCFADISWYLYDISEQCFRYLYGDVICNVWWSLLYCQVDKKGCFEATTGGKKRENVNSREIKLIRSLATSRKQCLARPRDLGALRCIFWVFSRVLNTQECCLMSLPGI